MTNIKKVTDSAKVEMQFRIEDTGYEKKTIFYKERQEMVFNCCQ